LTWPKLYYAARQALAAVKGRSSQHRYPTGTSATFATLRTAAAAAHLKSGLNLIDDIKAGLPNTPVSDKLRALLHIAHQVQGNGKNVTDEDIAAARKEGATDTEIHDTVLIAAAFCMFNRYVDGLGTWAPGPNEAYAEMGERMAHVGYGKY